MGIRKKLNESPRLAVLQTVLFVSVAVAFIYWYVVPSGRQANLAHEFFTDDGETWFTTTNATTPPFLHNGKQAVIAKVFRSQKGVTFVGYMAKYSDHAKKQLIDRGATGQLKIGTGVTAEGDAPGLLVKKPHDRDWVDARSAQGLQVMKIICPDGSTDYETLIPP